MPRESLLLIFVMATRAMLLGFATPAATLDGEPEADFNVYWNVPTFMCHKYGLYFEEVSEKYGILQNERDEFRGNEFAILYDPGMFPALLKDSSGRLLQRNGGVPQKGNLTKHLEVFREHLITQIPNATFSGIGVIDFESWRPIFRQNWASLSPYKETSIALVRKEHPLWNSKSVEQEARRRFEKYGKLFMEETLKLAKQYRPFGRWSYYAYPYCFNLTPNQPSSRCDRKAMTENDKLSWLFSRESVLLPSVYLRTSLTPKEKVGLVGGRIKEALRIARMVTPRQKVLPYYWYKHQDQRDKYLSDVDLQSTLRKISDLGADGLIIWGSSDDINSKEKCLQFRQYLNEVLGPIVYSVKQDASNGTRYNSSDSTENLIDLSVSSVAETL